MLPAPSPDITLPSCSLAQSLWALFTSSLAISLVFAVIPFCRDVKVLASVMALAGLAMGCIDTVANMQLVRMYQKDSAVFLQVSLASRHRTGSWGGCGSSLGPLSLSQPPPPGSHLPAGLVSSGLPSLKQSSDPCPHCRVSQEPQRSGKKTLCELERGYDSGLASPLLPLLPSLSFLLPSPPRIQPVLPFMCLGFSQPFPFCAPFPLGC